jgi:hypothetical protein
MSAKSIPVSDQQMSAIVRGALPLRRQDADAYFVLVAEALGRGPAPPGDGDIYRAILVAQRALFDPPDLDTHLGVSKYGRG